MTTKMIDQVAGYASYALVADSGERREKSEGGIIIPDSAKKTEWFKIVAVGSECNKGYVAADGSKKMLKKGDRIQFFQGVNVDIDGVRYQAVPENNIMIVLPGEAL